MCSKMPYYLYLLSFYCHVIDYSLVKMLLESVVLSHLSYCVVVWGPSLGGTLLIETLKNAELHSDALL